MTYQRLILILSLVLGLLLAGMQIAITSRTHAYPYKVDAATNWPLNTENGSLYPMTLDPFNPLASYGYLPLFGGYPTSMLFGGYQSLFGGYPTSMLFGGYPSLFGGYPSAAPYYSSSFSSLRQDLEIPTGWGPIMYYNLCKIYIPGLGILEPVTDNEPQK